MKSLGISFVHKWQFNVKFILMCDNTRISYRHTYNDTRACFETSTCMIVWLFRGVWGYFDQRSIVWCHKFNEFQQTMKSGIFLFTLICNGHFFWKIISIFSKFLNYLHMSEMVSKTRDKQYISNWKAFVITNRLVAIGLVFCLQFALVNSLSRWMSNS